MINGIDKLTEAYFYGLSSGLTSAALSLSTERQKRNRPCSRANCPLQHNENEKNFNSSSCQKVCEWYTPEFTIDDTINLLENLLAFAKQQKKKKMLY